MVARIRRVGWSAALGALVLVQLAPTAGLAGAPGRAFVRVNQVGYLITSPKRAYLMSSSAEAAGTYIVRSASGREVAHGTIGASRGSWSTAYPDVYAIDFDRLHQAGTYRIDVTGPIATRSPVFRIDTGSSIYSAAMANALLFYQNERDGPNYIPSVLRTAPGHLNDMHAVTYLTPTFDSNDNLVGDLTSLGRTIDASGAWWDAGDYLKFVATTSYVVGVMLVGATSFPAQASDFLPEAEFGIDWLSRMWDDQSRTLYYQVGIGGGNANILSDHDVWRLPQADDSIGGSDPMYRYLRNRPVLRAAPAGSLISPNLAGRLAADFALCYQALKRSDHARATQCLAYGEHVFDLANTSPRGNLLTAAPFDFYPETEWRDDMEWGATELYRALSSANPPAGLPHTDPTYYLRKAAHWAHGYIAETHTTADALNLYDVSGLAHYELYQSITGANDPVGLEVTPAALLADLRHQLDRALQQATTDPFGFGFPWDTFDTTTHGAGLSVLASEYDQLTGTSKFAAYADRWLSNILGANAWGTSLIVGDGQTYPHCLQHQVANLVGSLDGAPPILAGALVEGPNSFAATGVVSGMLTCPAHGGDHFFQFNNATAVFQDNVQSYSTVEPAIDLTAGSILAFAWRMRGQPGLRASAG